MVYIVVQMDISMKENEKKVIKKDKENGVKEQSSEKEFF